MSRERNAALAAIAATLPASRDELFAVARSALADFHDRIIAEDEAGAEAIKARYDAAIFALNSFDTCGTYADDDSPGNAVARHCAAKLGAVPRWGQIGSFVVESSGLRAAVKHAFFTGRISHFEFHAIDAGAPFISETGYRSHFQQPVLGCTVDEVAHAFFATLLAEKKTFIEQNYRNSLRTFAWLESQSSHPVSAYEDQYGQMAMMF